MQLRGANLSVPHSIFLFALVPFSCMAFYCFEATDIKEYPYYYVCSLTVSYSCQVFVSVLWFAGIICNRFAILGIKYNLQVKPHCLSSILPNEKELVLNCFNCTSYQEFKVAFKIAKNVLSSRMFPVCNSIIKWAWAQGSFSKPVTKNELAQWFHHCFCYATTNYGLCLCSLSSSKFRYSFEALFRMMGCYALPAEEVHF